MPKEKKKKELPEIGQLEEELKRVKYRQGYIEVMKSTLYILVVVVAISVLIATLCMPVLQIYGSSMNPTLTDGEIVLSIKGANFKSGDVIAFYHNNKILIKRCIAGPGDWVNIDQEGNVYVNGEQLDEPYVEEKSLGECNIVLPYQVPDGRYFVLGDHRSVSVDSRSRTIGCISEEEIVGKIVFKIWPLTHIGKIDN